jgi:hypothetical protein
MLTFLVLMGMTAIVSLMMTTKETRLAARKRLARHNPVFIAIILVELAIVLWPWPPFNP